MLVPPKEFDIDWNNYAEFEDWLYNEVYLKQIIGGRLSFLGLPVRLKRYPVHENGKAFTFYHLISEGKVEDDRTPDPERCRRLHWVPFILQNAMDMDSIKCWVNSRRRKNADTKNVVLWLKDYNYLVVLEKRHDFYLLKTAYLCLSEDWRIRKLELEQSESYDPRKQ